MPGVRCVKRFSSQAVCPHLQASANQPASPKPSNARPCDDGGPGTPGAGLRGPGSQVTLTPGPEHPGGLGERAVWKAMELGDHEILDEIYCKQLEI